MALTEKQKKARWNDFVAWYELHVASKQIGKPIPKELKTLYMANDGAWGTDRAMMWIRLHDPNYMRTKQATDRVYKMQQMYEQAFGYKINWKSPEMKKYLEGFARANPNINTDKRLTEIFMKRILPSKEFKKMNPGFMSWLTKNRQEYASADIMGALSGYNQHKERLADFWSTKASGTIPKELLDKAVANDWDTDNQDFLAALQNTREYAGSSGYSERSKEFADQWTSIFGKNTAVDAEMQDRYARNISGLTFSDFFHTTLKKSQVFKDKFAGYQKWEQDQHAIGGPEGSIDIFDYFKRRNELVDMWYDNFTGGELPDQALLDEAMSGNWGDALFLNKIRATPQYANTGAGKDKAAKFDNYWRGLFGESAPIDLNLRSRFIGSQNSDPGVYWDDIKKTDQFKKTFSNYDVFAGAQANTGVAIVQDPMAYNQYKEAFKKAFEDIGEELPKDMERTIFASGVSGEDLQRRAETWRTTEQSYQRQTGQKADLGKTLGVTGNKAQAGDMRMRMQRALEQQRALAKSKFARVDTTKDQQTGFIKQNI